MQVGSLKENSYKSKSFPAKVVVVLRNENAVEFAGADSF
jgi:hypothetical protein